MQRRIYWIVGILELGFSLVTSPAWAQALKPGTWAINHTVKSESGKAERELASVRERFAKMSPAERQLMQAMMARQGLSLTAGELVSRSCITPDMAAKPQVPVSLLGSACESTTTPLSKQRYKVQVSCTSPPTAGEGELIITSPTAYVMNLVVEKTQPTAPNQPTDKWPVTLNGRFEDSSCDPSRNFVMPSMPNVTQTFAPYLPKKPTDNR